MTTLSTTASTLKERVNQSVDKLSGKIEELSKKIHDHPELCFEEVKACQWLTEFLKQNGFEIENNLAGVETAFRASFGSGDGPTIAILCEYDALPGIGHACGHNLIASSGAGAGAALAAIKDQLPKGRIQVIGTPAEEGGGGKVKLIEGGVFKDVDCAMMIHGFDRTMLHQDLLGIVRVKLEFTGKASHASADPWEGVNALDACVQAYNAISMLRQQMKPACRIHGIITDGGAAANIIPEYASAMYYVRAPKIEEMWELHKKVVACAEGAAKATGASVKVSQCDYVYEPMISNSVLLELFSSNLKAVGLKEQESIKDRIGSSDIGNVSQVVPTIHPYIMVAPQGTPIHTREFADAVVKPLAHSNMLAAAKTMAMVAVDLLTQPERVKEAKAEHASVS